MVITEKESFSEITKISNEFHKELLEQYDESLGFFGLTKSFKSDVDQSAEKYVSTEFLHKSTNTVELNNSTLSIIDEDKEDQQCCSTTFFKRENHSNMTNYASIEQNYHYVFNENAPVVEKKNFYSKYNVIKDISTNTMDWPEKQERSIIVMNVQTSTNKITRETDQKKRVPTKGKDPNKKVPTTSVSPSKSQNKLINHQKNEDNGNKSSNKPTVSPDISQIRPIPPPKKKDNKPLSTTLDINSPRLKDCAGVKFCASTPKNSPNTISRACLPLTDIQGNASGCYNFFDNKEVNYDVEICLTGIPNLKTEDRNACNVLDHAKTRHFDEQDVKSCHGVTQTYPSCKINPQQSAETELFDRTKHQSYYRDCPNLNNNYDNLHSRAVPKRCFENDEFVRICPELTRHLDSGFQNRGNRTTTMKHTTSTKNEKRHLGGDSSRLDNREHRDDKKIRKKHKKEEESIASKSQDLVDINSEKNEDNVNESNKNNPPVSTHSSQISFTLPPKEKDNGSRSNTLDMDPPRIKGCACVKFCGPSHLNWPETIHRACLSSSDFLGKATTRPISSSSSCLSDNKTASTDVETGKMGIPNHKTKDRNVCYCRDPAKKRHFDDITPRQTTQTCRRNNRQLDEAELFDIKKHYSYHCDCQNLIDNYIADNSITFPKRRLENDECVRICQELMRHLDYGYPNRENDHRSPTTNEKRHLEEGSRRLDHRKHRNDNMIRRKHKKEEDPKEEESTASASSSKSRDNLNEINPEKNEGSKNNSPVSTDSSQVRFTPPPKEKDTTRIDHRTTTANVKRKNDSRRLDYREHRNGKTIHRKRQTQSDTSNDNNKLGETKCLCSKSGEIDGDELSSDQEPITRPNRKCQEEDAPSENLGGYSDYHPPLSRLFPKENCTECRKYENFMKEPTPNATTAVHQQPHPTMTTTADSLNLGRNITIQIIPNCDFGNKNNMPAYSWEIDRSKERHTKIVRDFSDEKIDKTSRNFCACECNVPLREYRSDRPVKRKEKWWRISCKKRQQNRGTHTTRDRSVNTAQDPQSCNCQRVVPISNEYKTQPPGRHFNRHLFSDLQFPTWNFNKDHNNILNKLNKGLVRDLFNTPCPSTSTECSPNCLQKVRGAPFPLCARTTFQDFPNPSPAIIQQQHDVSNNAISPNKDELLTQCLKYLTKKLSRCNNKYGESEDDESSWNSYSNFVNCHHNCGQCCRCSCSQKRTINQEVKETKAKSEEKTTVTTCQCMRGKTVQTKPSIKHFGTSTSKVTFKKFPNKKTESLTAPPVKSQVRKKRYCRQECCRCCVPPRCCQCEPNLRYGNCCCQCQRQHQQHEDILKPSSGILEKFIEILLKTKKEEPTVTEKRSENVLSQKKKRDVKSCQCCERSKSSVKSTNTSPPSKLKNNVSCLRTKVINNVTLDLCSLGNQNFRNILSDRTFSKFGVPSRPYPWSCDTFLRSMRNEIGHLMGNKTQGNLLLEDSVYYDPTPCLTPVILGIEGNNTSEVLVEENSAQNDSEERRNLEKVTNETSNSSNDTTNVPRVADRKIDSQYRDEPKQINSRKSAPMKPSNRNVNPSKIPKLRDLKGKYSSVSACTTRTGLMCFVPSFRDNVVKVSKNNHSSTKNDKKMKDTISKESLKITKRVTSAIKCKKDDTNPTIAEDEEIKNRKDDKTIPKSSNERNVNKQGGIEVQTYRTILKENNDDSSESPVNINDQKQPKLVQMCMSTLYENDKCLEKFVEKQPVIVQMCQNQVDESREIEKGKSIELNPEEELEIFQTYLPKDDEVEESFTDEDEKKGSTDLESSLKRDNTIDSSIWSSALAVQGSNIFNSQE